MRFRTEPSSDLLTREPAGSTAGALRGPRSTGKRTGVLTVVAIVFVAGVLGFVGYEISLPLAGIVYAVLFMAVTVFRPDLAFLIIFLGAPLVWDLGGGPVNMAIADISLMLAAPILIIRFFLSGRRVASNPLLIPVGLYLLCCIVSTLMNGGALESATSMFQMLLYMGLTLFLYSNCVDHPDQMLSALYGLLATDVILSIALLSSRSNYVLGLHKNAMGSELDYAVVIAVELWLAKANRRQNKMFISLILLIVGAGLLMSLSRGGWLGAIVGVLFLFILHGQVKLAVKSILLLLPLVVCFWILLPQDSKDYAVDFGNGARNIQARYESFYYAWDLFKQAPVLGLGVGLRKTYDATNVIMSTLAETGIVGLIAFLSIFVAMFRMVFKTCRGLSLASPEFSLSAIAGALMAAKFAHGCVDHYWSRVMLPVWAAAGMGVYSYNIARRSVGTRLPTRTKR